MKASELRIGNLIMFRNFIEPQEIQKVDSKVLMKAPGDYGDFEFNEYWQPIELTEEWLLKFGFKIDMNNFNFNASIGDNDDEFDLALRYADSSGWFYRSKRTPIKYVHQLQNLYYALTGKELIAK